MSIIEIAMVWIDVRKDRLFRVDNLVRVINENQNIVLMLIAADAVLFLVGIFIYSDIYYYERDFFFYQQSVYADGLTQENLPPASLGDREGSLFVKISPPIYTTETKGNAFMQFRLFDARTNETIKFVTYDITVTKGTNPSPDERPLLRDFFQSPSGLLTLRVEPTNDTSLTIFGNQDPFLGAWVSDPGGTINIRGPLLQEGGLYRFDIQIFGIDNPRNIFTPENAPTFETFLSVGDVYNFEDLQYMGQTFNSTLISYYDEIQDFNFDSETGSFSWSMPFYYNTTRLRDNPIFVHEEIKIPKALFGDSIFNATVNGDPVSGRTLAIDPFADPDAVILHYLISKNDIIRLAEQWQRQQQQQQGVSTDLSSNATISNIASETIDISNISTESTGDDINNQTGLMTFVLDTSGRTQNAVQQQESNITSPAAENLSETQESTADGERGGISIGQITSSDLISDTGGIHAAVSWSPTPLLSSSNSTVRINFTDAFSGGPLNADVIYDLVILDDNGTQVAKKEALLAENSTDTQSLSFPAGGRYQLELYVNGLLLEDQDTHDLPRNGVARGYVIVSSNNI